METKFIVAYTRSNNAIALSRDGLAYRLEVNRIPKAGDIFTAVFDHDRFSTLSNIKGLDCTGDMAYLGKHPTAAITYWEGIPKESVQLELTF